MENTEQEALRALYSDVTQQIFIAERLDDDQSPDDERLAAWAEVSQTEEVIASTLALSAVERGIAQRGAIAAAEKSGNKARADALRQQYGI
jgi:hypothetical protein